MEEEAEEEGAGADIFHEWQLDRPADIVQVRFLQMPPSKSKLRRFTTGLFLD
jgi:hypothetical protein